MRYYIHCRKSTEADDRQILSIESQHNETLRAFGNKPSIEVVRVFEESFSAKAPGRPVFDEMMRGVERGDAEGIIAWHPDRLARNSVDAGKIIWFLDRGILKDLKFVTYTFENNPQGKLMLSLLLGQSKYYVDALSENVKRGNRTKIEMGWRPNHAPIGYLNCRDTRTIIIDPERSPIIRGVFEHMLTGTWSSRQIYEMARDEWGLRTVRHRKLGGKPVSLAGIYRILTNPFYAGTLMWNGQAYPGKHVPLVTPDEFEAVQKRLGRPHVARPKRRTFTFRGMVRCGACGMAITAEEKTNRYGSRYTYYHCTKRNITAPRCRQPAVHATDLETQILAFLERVTLPGRHHQWTLEQVRAEKPSREADESARIRLLEKALADAARKLSALIDLKLRDMIRDDEFAEKRLQLQQEQLRLRSRIEAAKAESNAFEPVADFVSFSSKAADWFRAGAVETKRLIL